MIFEKLTPEDLEQVIAIAKDTWEFDPFLPNCLAEKLERGSFHDRDLCFSARNHINGPILGFVIAVQRNQTGIITAISVAADQLGRGVGSAMLQHLQSLFQSRAVQQIRLGESAPNYLWPGLDPRYTRAYCFFTSRGFQTFGSCFSLHVDLRQSTIKCFEGQLSPHIRISRAQLIDREPLLALTRAEFPSWEAEVGRAFLFHPIPLHLGWLDQQLVAFSGHSLNNSSAPWFGPMGTTSYCRGRGIGKQLLLNCLADLASLGFEQAIIPWVGPVRFYAETVNAKIFATYFHMEKPLTPL